MRVSSLFCRMVVIDEAFAIYARASVNVERSHTCGSGG